MEQCSICEFHIQSEVDDGLPNLRRARTRSGNEALRVMNRGLEHQYIICVGLPPRISTMVPPGSVGALIAAASRFDIPSNIARIGASTPCSSIDCAKAGVARLVTTFRLNTITNCFACLYMVAIQP